MNKNIVMIVLLIIVGIGAFYGGMQYQKSQRTTLAQYTTAQGQFGGQGQTIQGNRRLRQGGQNGSAIRGKIMSVSGSTITIQEQDGSSKIILFSNSTTISKATTGSASDLITGTQVMAGGTTNSDGSVTAQFIQINPMAMRRAGSNAKGLQQ